MKNETYEEWKKRPFPEKYPHVAYFIMWLELIAILLLL